MFSKILVPCDVSYGTNEWLDPTIRAAWDLADKYGSHVTFLTVVPENLIKGFFTPGFKVATERHNERAHGVNFDRGKRLE